ncbi:MAG: RloB domain-containing protein [Clostridiales bacterium]|nr:RloB domain-containing protein [Clostridiales bacterium]
MAGRKANRKPHSRQIGTRAPLLGHYIIVTDTEKTEYNYLTGLKSSLSSDLQRKLKINVIRNISTNHLLDEALRVKSESPQFADLWIVFDRDEVKEYDRIIEEADRKGIHVGWSNPCIEIWFHAYLGKMPTTMDSVCCCKNFSNSFQKETGYFYDKSDFKIYETLCKIGNESNAVEIANRRYNEHLNNGKCKPSDMNPCTTLHELIGEIKCKCRQSDETFVGQLGSRD